MRKKLALTLGFAALAAVGAAVAAIGPTGPGQFYTYYDDNGTVVGYSAIRCDNTRESWGKFTKNYSDGYFICDPEI
ncbi:MULTISPECIES: DUF6289 family protein [Lysobacter]|jgi:hypothetical protein|uniref:Secreted protein n=1 Tax=Lysobacter antibioticus TaxID=84531 RepID=A0A0S2FEL1_LYSAN|nr:MULTISPECIES: DUF6289 family protein [Lysobacter]ALN61884.1 hypothetical protein GLA29479_1001 [Lysobacter antibioticus]ALN81964.1 hypothetical protein LA76x_3843 [Lysobacter antibioticus]